jgi:hypothetical protein
MLFGSSAAIPVNNARKQSDRRESVVSCGRVLTRGNNCVIGTSGSDRSRDGQSEDV